MKLRALLAAAVPALIAGLAWAQQSPSPKPRGVDFFNQARRMRPFQQSILGAGDGDLLRLAMEEAGRQADLSDGQAPDETELQPTDLEDEAKRALARMAVAYRLKMRGDFMRLFSDRFAGNLGAVEDAVTNDMRVYRSINLYLNPDRVDVQGNRASIQAQYDMNLVDNTGRDTKFSGVTRFIFQAEEGRVLLVQMDQPIIFGNSLAPNQNPMATTQGPSVSKGSSAPGCGTPIEGNATLVEFADGYRFDIQSNVPVGSGGNDLMITDPDFITPNGGFITQLGSGSLDSIHTIPTNFTTNRVGAVTGMRYALKTRRGRFAIFRLNYQSPPVGLGITGKIEFKFQPTGLACF